MPLGLTSLMPSCTGLHVAELRGQVAYPGAVPVSRPLRSACLQQASTCASMGIRLQEAVPYLLPAQDIGNF